MAATKTTATSAGARTTAISASSKTTAISAAKTTATSAGSKTTAISAGYSGTPLPKKLGWADGGRLALVHAPAGIEADIAPKPMGATLAATLAAEESLVLLFCEDAATLKKSLARVSRKLAADGTLWISWPKKSSKLFVDLTEDGIRAIVLPTGLVDVKVRAINEDWSGLKLMVRKELRAKWNQ